MIDKHGLQVAPALARFLEEEALPGTGLEADAFWRGAAGHLRAARAGEPARCSRSATISRPGSTRAPERERRRRISCARSAISPTSRAPFAIDPGNVDDEVARIAGPQLVVPVLNARFLLNAANARWGSLYDALYGTDALPGTPQGPGYDRGARRPGDRAGAGLSRRDAAGLGSGAGRRRSSGPGRRARTARLLFRHNGLHIELVVDRAHPIGRDDPLGIADVVLEAALTTIVDLEDSVAAVDAAGQGRRLSQLARADEGRSRGQLRQRRPHRRPRAEPRTASMATLTLPGRACSSCAMSAI